jgi:hypothetical protein
VGLLHLHPVANALFLLDEQFPVQPDQAVAGLHGQSNSATEASRKSLMATNWRRPRQLVAQPGGVSEAIGVDHWDDCR